MQATASSTERTSFLRDGGMPWVLRQRARLAGPFVRMLFGVLVPALVLTILYSTPGLSLPLRASYLVAGGMAVGLTMATQMSHARFARLHALGAGGLACSLVLAVPWVALGLFSGYWAVLVSGACAVGAAQGRTEALVMLPMSVAWVALSLLPILVACVLGVWFSDSLRAAAQRLQRRAARGLAVLGFVAPVLLGSAVEFGLTRAESHIVEEFVHSDPPGDVTRLPPYRAITLLHNWQQLDLLCNYGKYPGKPANEVERRARETQFALTGYRRDRR